jgi:acetylornithine deacetylase/succinyl-diaminopimelate desuccinylase-like protein
MAAMDTAAEDALTAQTVELLQEMIRNACVNEGTIESGQEVRNAELLVGLFEGAGLDVETFESAPGRTSVVARVDGFDSQAPSLCLNGHTDVVPVNPAGWDRDPFGGELVDGEIWGRGAVDMLNLTSSMAVVFRHLKTSGFRPRGDLVFLGVADEESGSAYGARWLAQHHRDVIGTDYVLTENGGLHLDSTGDPVVTVRVGEKGVAWRRLRVRGTPGHGSAPYKTDNALMKAAAVVTRIGDYKPTPRFHELWRAEVSAMNIDEQAKRRLLDEAEIDAYLDELPPAEARYFHACSHTTFSPNVLSSQTKTNVIPDEVIIDVDIRTVAGEGPQEVQAHLEAALGDLAAHVEVEPLLNDRASMSPADTPLWDALQRAVARPFPQARLRAGIINGFTDARVHRELGAIAYGAGLLSPSITPGEFGSRFPGNNERIDIESLRLTTHLWNDVTRDLLG